MASGFGTRFGSNKLLYMIKGKPLYLHALESLIGAGEKLSPDIIVMIVVVSQYSEIISEAQNRGVQAVFNPDSQQGITASIKLGLSNLPKDTEHFGFFVADQPGIDSGIMEAWIRQYAASHKGIGCVSAGGHPGNPAVFSRKYIPELLALEGDRGGKQILLAHMADTFLYPVDEQVLIDIDKMEDISREQ